MVLRVGVVPAEVCPPVTTAEVDAAAVAAVDWIVRNQEPSGRFMYGYHRADLAVNTGYNDARHGGVVMSLYQAYAVLGLADALASADAAVGFALADLRMEPDWAAWAPGGDIPVGANALLLAGLAIRRDTTGDPVWDAEMRAIGRFLAAQQQPNGSIYASWRPSTGLPVPEYGLYATGEAAWALALLDGIFPGEGWGEAAARTLEYLATERDRAEGLTLAPLPDHWAAYTIATLRPDLRTPAQVDYARSLAGYFGMRLRFEAQRRGTGINLWLRWYPGPPAGVGTAAEGIGALRTVAVTEPGLADLLPNIDERIVCTAGFMVDRQVTPAEAVRHPEPGRVEGAWFYRDYAQMDDTQHVLSSLLAARTVVSEEEDR